MYGHCVGVGGDERGEEAGRGVGEWWGSAERTQATDQSRPSVYGVGVALALGPIPSPFASANRGAAMIGPVSAGAQLLRIFYEESQ